MLECCTDVALFTAYAAAEAAIVPVDRKSQHTFFAYIGHGKHRQRDDARRLFTARLTFHSQIQVDGVRLIQQDPPKCSVAQQAASRPTSLSRTCSSPTVAERDCIQPAAISATGTVNDGRKTAGDEREERAASASYKRSRNLAGYGLCEHGGYRGYDDADWGSEFTE